MNKWHIAIALSVLLLVPVGAQNAFADVWDYSDDFELVVPQSGGTGPTPSWFYYFDETTVVGVLDFDGDYELGDNINTVFGFNCYDEAPGGFFLICEPLSAGAPGVVAPLGFASGIAFGDTVVGFQTPQQGTYNVQGTFNRPDTAGNGVCVSITKHNPADIGVPQSDQNIPEFPVVPGATCNTNPNVAKGVLIPGGTGTEINFDFEIDLLCGEQLFFRVNPNGNDSLFDSTLLDIQITDIVLNPQPGDACPDPPTSEPQVGGAIIPINATDLVLTGAQSFSWMIPLVMSGIGIGLFVISRKSDNS